MLNKLVNINQYPFFSFKMSLNDYNLKRKNNNTVILVHNTDTQIMSNNLPYVLNQQLQKNEQTVKKLIGLKPYKEAEFVTKQNLGSRSFILTSGSPKDHNSSEDIFSLHVTVPVYQDLSSCESQWSTNPLSQTLGDERLSGYSMSQNKDSLYWQDLQSHLRDDF